MIGVSGLTAVVFLVYLGGFIYTVVLATRFVRAVEKIADKFEAR